MPHEFDRADRQHHADRTSLAWQRDRGEPIRTSPDSSRNEPIAMAGPVAAMITGFGKVRQRAASSNPLVSMPRAAFESSFSARSKASLRLACMVGERIVGFAVVHRDGGDGFGQVS